MGARKCKDLVQAKEFIGEFLGGSCHTEELSLDIYLASNLEFWSWKSLGISGSLILTLSFRSVLSELLVLLIEVCDKVTSTHGCKVTLWMNGEVQMITLVGKEGCNAGSGTWSIVISELS